MWEFRNIYFPYFGNLVELMVVSHLPAGSQVGELCDEVVGVRQDPTGEHHHVQGDLDCAVPRPAGRYDIFSALTLLF